MPNDATIASSTPDSEDGGAKQDLAAVPVEFARAVRAIEDGQKLAGGAKPAVFVAANGRRILLK